MPIGDIDILLRARDQASARLKKVRDSVDDMNASMQRAEGAQRDASAAQRAFNDALDESNIDRQTGSIESFGRSFGQIAGKVGKAATALKVFYDAFQIGQSLRQDNKDIVNGLTAATDKLVAAEQKRLQLIQQQTSVQTALSKLRFGDDNEGFLKSEKERLEREIKTQTSILESRKKEAQEADLSILNTAGINKLGFFNASIKGAQDRIKFTKQAVNQSRNLIDSLRQEQGKLSGLLAIERERMKLKESDTAEKTRQSVLAQSFKAIGDFSEKLVEQQKLEQNLISSLELKLIKQREGADAAELERARRKGISDEILKQAAGLQQQVAIEKNKAAIDKERAKIQERIKKSLRQNRSGDLNPLESRTLTRGNVRREDERIVERTDKLIELEEKHAELTAQQTGALDRIEKNTRNTPTFIGV